MHMYAKCDQNICGARIIIIFTNEIIVSIRGVCNIVLTLKAPIATKIACFSRLLKCLISLYGKQCEQSVLGPRCLLLYLIRQ